MNILGFQIRSRRRAEQELKNTREFYNEHIIRLTESFENDERYIESRFSEGNRVRFTPQQALAVPTVAASLRALAGAVAQMRVNIMQEFADGDIAPYSKPGLFRLLNTEPSPKWSAAAMWSHVVQDVYLYGNAYVLIERPVGRDPVSLIPLRQEQVRIDDKSNPTRLQYGITNNGKEVVVDQNQILHFHTLEFDGVRGKSFLETGGNVMLELDQYMYGYVSDYYQVGAQQDKILIMKGYDENQINAVQEKYDRRYKKGNKGRSSPMVFNQDVSVQNAGGLNLAEQQLIDSRRDNRIELAKSLGVPPTVIGMEGPQTGKGIAELGTHFLRYGLQPLLTMVEGEINRKIFRRNNYSATRSRKFVRFDTMSLARGTFMEWGATVRQLVGEPGAVGVISRNEARTMLGLRRLSGEEYDRLSDGGPNNVPTEQPRRRQTDEQDNED